MKPEPLVSVITPFYNTDPAFLQEAVESVFQQTYPHWELLLIDDGTTGTSTQVAQRYSEQCPDRVRCLEHDSRRNRGMSASRNLGLQQARGEHIAFLDADDVWLPHKLEQQVALLDSHPDAAMVYGNTQYWYGWTGRREDAGRDYQPNLGLPSDRLVHPPTLLSLYLEARAAVPCICSVLVRREAIQSVGGFEAGFRDLYEDQVFYAKQCLAAPVFVSRQCWDRYRQHPGSSTAVASKAKHADRARQTFLNWLEGYLAEQGVQDALVWRALRRAQWRNRHPTLARLLRSVRRLAQRVPGGVNRWPRT